MRREMVLVKVLVCLFSLSLSASFVQAHPTAKVPKTGQTTSYYTGDDGDYEKGVAWPSPRFTDNGDQTVTDNLTGLMWTKDADLFGPKRWKEAINACENLELGVNGCNIYSDWRLPNISELESLRHRGYVNPSLSNTAGTGRWSEGNPFTDVQSLYYWSSTTYGYGTDTINAWGVGMYFGYVDSSYKDNSYCVWPVRGGQ